MMESAIAINLKEYRKSERSGGYHFLAIYSDYKVIFGRMSMLEEPFQQEYSYDAFLNDQYDPLVKKKFGIKRIRDTKEVLGILLEYEGKPYIKKWESGEHELVLLRNEKNIVLSQGGSPERISWEDFLFDPFQKQVKDVMGKEIAREVRKTIELIQRHSA